MMQVFRFFLSFEIQSKFHNMYCFLIACHSRTLKNLFLCTDMTKKITFKMVSSLEQSIFICSTVPLAVCDHAVFHLFLAHHFIVCYNVFSYDTFSPLFQNSKQMPSCQLWLVPPLHTIGSNHFWSKIILPIKLHYKVLLKQL